MDTLIELYDERAIENILAPDMFRPQRIICLCPGEIAQDRKRQEKLSAFFRRRGWTPELIFMEASLFKADRILRQLLAIGEKYPDCALDVTGGSDAALFAAGLTSYVLWMQESGKSPSTIPTDNNGINNRYGLEITKEVKIPEVKEIHIKLPTAEPKRTLLPKPEKKEFVF